MGPIDARVLAGCAFYFAAVFALVELSRRRFRIAPDVSRKTLLACIGMWSIPAVFLFPTRAWAVTPYLVVTGLTWLSFRLELFESLEDDGPGIGSVLFPLSCAVLLAVFWEARVEIALAAIMAVTWGDTLGALVGRRLGTRKYHVRGHARTMEGTLAVMFGSAAAIAPMLALFGGGDWHQAVAFSLIAGTVAASVEAASIHGIDNVTVPAATAATLYALSSLSRAGC